MKITKKELRTMILQEMRSMHSAQVHDPMDDILRAAGGCPIKAMKMLKHMVHRLQPMYDEKMMHHSDPATSGQIPPGQRLMGDGGAYMEQKKPTAVRGAGGALGIAGPGFR